MKLRTIVLIALVACGTEPEPTYVARIGETTLSKEDFKERAQKLMETGYKHIEEMNADAKLALLNGVIARELLVREGLRRGLDREPSAEARADDGGGDERVGEVGDHECQVVERVGPLGAFAAAESGQLRRDDREALSEAVEERRPRGRELVVDEEQARAASGAEGGYADLGEVDGDLGWRHGGATLIAVCAARFKRCASVWQAPP